MKQIATKTDTVDTLPANAFNSLSDENQNAVTKSGQTLDATAETSPDPNPTQLARAITKAAQEARAYSDSGAANAYVLTAVGSWQQPTAYTNGMTIEFIGANANTGASTVNVAGLGVVDITTVTGSAINAGDIGPNTISRIRYNSSSGDFLLEPSGSSSGSGSGSGAKNYILNPDGAVDNSNITVTGGMAAAKWQTLADLPEESKGTGIKVSLTSGVAGDSATFEANPIDDADDGFLGSSICWYKTLSGYTDDDFLFIVEDETNSEILISEPIKAGQGRLPKDSFNHLIFRAGNNLTTRFEANTGVTDSNGLVVSGVGELADTSNNSEYKDNWEDVTGTLTYSAGFGTITNESVYRKLDGDSYKYLGFFKCGTVSATGGKHIQFPFSINTGKLPSNAGLSTIFNPKGGANIQVATNAFGNVDLLLGIDTALGSNGIYFKASPTSTDVFGSAPAVNVIFATGDNVIWHAELPIQGINSSTITPLEILLQNARVIYTSNNGASYADASVIKFEDIVKDPFLQYNTATGQYLVKTKGDYRIRALTAVTVAATWGLGVALNGTRKYRGQLTTSGYADIDVTLENLVPGDLITLLNSSGSTRTLTSDAEFNYIIITKESDRSAQIPGVPTTDLGDDTDRYVIPRYREGGEGNLGTITNWASPGSKKYKWVRNGNVINFFWYITATGGSASTSATNLDFNLPAGVPTPANHISNDAFGEFPVPCGGAASSGAFVKNFIDNNSGTYRINGAFSSSTSASYWVGIATWTVLPSD